MYSCIIVGLRGWALQVGESVVIGVIVVVCSDATREQPIIDQDPRGKVTLSHPLLSPRPALQHLSSPLAHDSHEYT